MRILESSLIPHKYSLKSSVVRLSVPDMGNGGSFEGTLWATCEDTLFIRSSSGRRMPVSSGVHRQFCLNRKKCHHLYTCSIHLQFLVSSLQNKIKIKYIEFSLFSNEVQNAFKLPRFSGEKPALQTLESLHCRREGLKKRSWNPQSNAGADRFCEDTCNLLHLDRVGDHLLWGTYRVAPLFIHHKTLDAQNGCV